MELTASRSHDSFRAMSQDIYSLRMRSSIGSKHISGAERLLEFPKLEDAASALLTRALNHSRGAAEKISITLQPLAREQLIKRPLLNFSTIEVNNWLQGRQVASELLVQLGLRSEIVKSALSQLAAGPSPDGGVMRGAMLVDAETGQRLESDPARGIRVSRMDLDPAAQPVIDRLLQMAGLCNSRIVEAWVLASKVTLYPQIIAELCWSDDPDYLTGYVASAQHGYQRITHLKEYGNEIGGRVFFIKPATDLGRLIDKLQLEPVLFTPPAENCL